MNEWCCALAMGKPRAFFSLRWHELVNLGHMAWPLGVRGSEGCQLITVGE